jgi:hypothetical protein
MYIIYNCGQGLQVGDPHCTFRNIHNTAEKMKSRSAAAIIVQKTTNNEE